MKNVFYKNDDAQNGLITLRTILFSVESIDFVSIDLS